MMEEIRRKCEEWDEEFGCLLDYPEECLFPEGCPFYVECAEEEEEGSGGK